MYNVEFSAKPGRQNPFFVCCEFWNVRCLGAASASRNSDPSTRGAVLDRFRFGMTYRVYVYVNIYISLFFSGLFVGQLVYIYMYPIFHTERVEKNHFKFASICLVNSQITRSKI